MIFTIEQSKGTLKEKNLNNMDVNIQKYLKLAMFIKLKYESYESNILLTKECKHIVFPVTCYLKNLNKLLHLNKTFALNINTFKYFNVNIAFILQIICLHIILLKRVINGFYKNDCLNQLFLILYIFTEFGEQKM